MNTQGPKDPRKAVPVFDLLVKRRKAEYFAAVRAGLNRNYEPMGALFFSALEDASSS